MIGNDPVFDADAYVLSIYQSIATPLPTHTVPLPKPSAETRESYVKLVSQFAEKAKQNIRYVGRYGTIKILPALPCH